MTAPVHGLYMPDEHAKSERILELTDDRDYHAECIAEIDVELKQLGSGEAPDRFAFATGPVRAIELAAECRDSAEARHAGAEVLRGFADELEREGRTVVPE